MAKQIALGFPFSWSILKQTMYEFEQHNLAVFSDHSEQISILQRYFIHARSQGRRIGLFVHGVDQNQFLGQLESPELKLSEGLQLGWFVCTNALEAYYPGGEFNSSEMIQTIRHYTLISKGDGYTGLSVAGMMDWTSNTKVSAGAIAEYEHSLFPLNKELPEFQGLCMYDRRHHRAEEIALECICHPRVISMQSSQRNPLSLYEKLTEVTAFPNLDEVRNYLKLIQSLGTKFDQFKGNWALWLRSHFEKCRSGMYQKFGEIGNTPMGVDLLKQIDLISAQMEHLELLAKMKDT